MGSVSVISPSLSAIIYVSTVFDVLALFAVILSGVLIASCLRGMVYLSTCECTFLTSYTNITLCERSVRRYDGKRHYFRRGVPLPQCFHEPEVRHR